MSAFTSLKSAIFPWRRGSAASESKVDVKESPVDGPKCALKVEHLEPAKAADKSRFPWRRQVSTGTDLDDSTPLKGPSARQESAALTESTCATLTPECSDTSSALSEPEDSTDEKLSDCSPKEPELSVVNEHGLKVSSNSWAAALQARRKKAEQGEALSHEEVVRKMKAILNKLTIEKFSSLSNQLISCGIRSTSLLEALTNEICEKATTQHHFVHMYADLCVALHDHFARQDQQKMNFKKILLSTCQASFEKHLTPPASLKTLKGEELKEAEQFYKLQMLGNIKFVGALIVRKMLAVRVMFAIIEELLSDPTSEALESLVALLTVVGPTFDQPEFPQQFLLAAIFQQVEGRTKDSCIKYRVRCLLKDLLELRASRWQDRKPKKLEGPSTLDEVAQKFHTEAEAKSPVANPVPHPLLLWRQESNSRPGPMPEAKVQCARFQVPGPMPESPNMPWRRSSPQSPVVQPMRSSPPTKAGPPSPSSHTTKAEPHQASPNASSLRQAGVKDKTASPLEEKLTRFFEANVVDEESCADLRACPVEIQELVLAKGDVTSARNPSAMLRVRINQAWREFKKISKATEPENYSKLEAKCSDPTKKKKKKTTQDKFDKGACRSGEKNLDKVDCFTSEKNLHKADCSACGDDFDKAACHKELAATYSELMTSHDVPEAVARIAAAAVPPSVQAEELSDFLVFIIEQGMDARAVGFELIASLFIEKHWAAAALQEGLQSFSSMYSDLKVDVPLLPKILCEEMALAFRPLVSSRLLSAELLQKSCGMSCQ
mmetsp:Transcript_115656/g.211808  ORF Transcript_115656/g.211808 Transcript_115656/m.211808 type:complete len:777 (-) Transcript_115656:104-2434(-)